MKPLTLEEAFKATIKRNLGAIEASILFDFVEKEIFVGEYFTRVPICKNHVRLDVLCIEGTKTEMPISILGKMDKLRKLLRSNRTENAWILEIKKELNFEALGQILVDKYYFPREYPTISVQCFGILCRSNDEWLEQVCRSYGIRVFEIRE